MMFKRTLLAASLGLLFAGNALAVTNGNFSQPRLSGWDTLGDVSRSFGGAVLTTASADDADDLPDAPGTYNASGIAAAEVGITGGVEEFAGLAISALDLGGFAYEGSVIKQSFNVAMGDTLHFDWNFFTNESRIDGQPDFAFVVIDGALSTLAFAADAAISSVPFDWTTGASTGVHGFSHVYTTGGISSVAFGVVDMGNYTTTSALWLDNLSVTPVPEPKDWMLMLAGLGLVGMMVSRSRRRMM